MSTNFHYIISRLLGLWLVVAKLLLDSKMSIGVHQSKVLADIKQTIYYYSNDQWSTSAC